MSEISPPRPSKLPISECCDRRMFFGVLVSGSEAKRGCMCLASIATGSRGISNEAPRAWVAAEYSGGQSGNRKRLPDWLARSTLLRMCIHGS